MCLGKARRWQTKALEKARAAEPWHLRQTSSLFGAKQKSIIEDEDSVGEVLAYSVCANYLREKERHNFDLLYTDFFRVRGYRAPDASGGGGAAAAKFLFYFLPVAVERAKSFCLLGLFCSSHHTCLCSK